MDSEIIAIMEQIYERHRAIVTLGIDTYLAYKRRRDPQGRYVATLRAGNVGYQSSWMCASFTSDDPLGALRQAAAYAAAHAVEVDDGE